MTTLESTEFIKGFVNSYLATAEWADGSENSQGKDYKFTKVAKKQAEVDCKEFISLVIANFEEKEAIDILTYGGHDLEYLAGHDFYLTRNGHGTGFWDKDIIYNELAEDAGNRLSNLAKKIGRTDLITNSRNRTYEFY